MPDFIKPKFVHVEPGGGSGGLIGGAVAVVVAAGAVVAAVRWLTEPHPVLETAIYTVFAVVLAASVVLVVAVLGSQRRRVPLRPGIHVDAAAPRPAVRQQAPRIPVAAAEPLQLPIVISSQPPAIVHNHLHLHGVSPADVADAFAARQEQLTRADRQHHAIEENT